MKAAPLLRTFLIFFLPYTILLSSSFAIFLWLEHSYHKQSLLSNERIQIELAKKSLVRDFETVLPDLNVLSNERHMHAFLNNPSATSRKLLIDELKSFLLQKRIYLLINILDTHGKEVIRVDYRNNRAITTPDDLLQDKSHRYYFQPALNLGLGELYVSPIDLNIENNTIEQPYIPVIRFATPLYDQNKKKQGVLVLNYLADNLLHHFDEMLSGSAGHVALLNNDGYWIRSHKREREWGFQLGKELKFSNNHPDVWKFARQIDSGNILVSNGLFTHTTVYPIEIIGGYSANEVQDEHFGHHHIDPKSYSWKIISDVPISVVNGKLHELIFGPVGFIWLLLIALGVIISRILAINYLERSCLQEQTALHARIFEATTDGIMITDNKSQIIAVNDAFSNITGYQQQEVIGKNPSMFSSGLQDKDFYKTMWTSINEHGYWAGEVYNKHKDGSIFAEWLRISAIKNKKGKTNHYVAILTDITQKKQKEEQLQKHAHYDALTGLHNRHAFDEILHSAIIHADYHKQKLALLFIDLDKFKPVNDIYGHDAGDAVLQTTAGRLLNGVRGMDTVSRIGGDEFTVILNDIKSRENAESISETLLATFRDPVFHKNIALETGASIGIAIFPDDAQDAQTLIEFADKAMYQKKHHYKK